MKKALHVPHNTAGRAEKAAQRAASDNATGDSSATGGASNLLRPLPTPNGGITYERWRSKYVREYHGGLYVAHNAKHLLLPANAVTVSEVLLEVEPILAATGPATVADAPRDSCLPVTLGLPCSLTAASGSGFRLAAE